MTLGATGGPGPTRWLQVRSTTIDRGVATVLAPVVGTVVVALAAWVRHQDGGPGVIGLRRSGAGGRTFSMWKLRTMRAVAPDGSSTGATITAAGDDRITPIGARLRRWRLDELAQLANVVLGDMALLGPRPETPGLVDLGDPAWQRVLAVRPGVAGPTQLVVDAWEATILAPGEAEVRYRDEVLPVKLAIDRWYVETASPALDALVLWSMLERFVLGRGATRIEARVRREVPEAQLVPVASAP